MTIKEAYEEINAVIPQQAYVSIDVDCCWHTGLSKRRSELETEFMIYIGEYDGKPSERYEAPTLDAAMDLFRASLVKPATVDEVDAVLV